VIAITKSLIDAAGMARGLNARHRRVDQPVFVPTLLEASMSVRKSLFTLATLAIVALQPMAAVAQQSDAAAYSRLARDAAALSRSDAEGLEALLNDRPDDLTARVKLLGFYFRGAMGLYGHDATIEARRRHILWLIAHHPDSEVVDLSEATIDRAGHALADPAGYAQASALWLEEARRHEASGAVLRHAARFFQLSDKERAVSLLRQAQRAEPGNRELSAQIGYVYALAILGVEMINQNGLPTSHNLEEARGDFAVRAIGELKASPDAITVGIAGTVVGQYGLMLSGMLRGTGKFAVDYFPLAEAFLGHAREIDPANAAWASNLEELRKLRASAR